MLGERTCQARSKCKGPEVSECLQGSGDGRRLTQPADRGNTWQMAGEDVRSMKDRQVMMKSFCSSPPPNLE